MYYVFDTKVKEKPNFIVRLLANVYHKWVRANSEIVLYKSLLVKHMRHTMHLKEVLRQKLLLDLDESANEQSSLYPLGKPYP